MNWTSFTTYGDGYQRGFETLCDQLFERYLKRTYKQDLIKFRVINGAGGDGGIEAYGELKSRDIIAIQAKWFKETIEDIQIRQIRDSVETAMSLRPKIKEYFICVPRPLGSTKFGRGAKGQGPKPVVKTEESRIDNLTNELEGLYPELTINWWFEQDIELQVQESDNEGIHKFWFEKEIISFKHLVDQFELQKCGWLSERYIPELHANGIIREKAHQILYTQQFRDYLYKKIDIKLSQFVLTERLIQKLSNTLSENDPLKIRLSIIKDWILQDLDSIKPILTSIEKGVENFNMPTLNQENIDGDLMNMLGEVEKTNIRKGILERLLEAFNKINSISLEDLLKEIQQEINQSGCLFIGDSGTGKTHGLSNIVENHLNDVAPAIIISAKGTPCSNWTEILNKALELNGWDKNHILSSLETLAVRNDHKIASDLKPGEDSKKELTRVVLCIDGLEEDTANWQQWYHRMKEGVKLSDRYNRVKFIFSARSYYLDQNEVPKSSTFCVVRLPKEGDIPIFKVIDEYFSEEHFNIKIKSKSQVKGLDSLFALRLFCEENRNKSFEDNDQIITAEKALLNKKVSRLDLEFMKKLNPGTTNLRSPVRDILNIIADHFYEFSAIDHNDLFDLIKPNIGKYLTDKELDILINYVSDNGLITKSIVPDKKQLLHQDKITYQVTTYNLDPTLTTIKKIKTND